MQELVIEPKDESKKGRSFRAMLLAHVRADLLWEGGSAVTDAKRPVWAMFGGSDNELRAFIANLRVGRKAVIPRSGYSRSKSEEYEFLKSSRYQVLWQREEEGSIATLYLPTLFQMDPGLVDPTKMQFVLLPTREWHDRQKIDSRALVQHAIRLGHEVEVQQIIDWTPLSYLFASYVDRRTRCPLIADGRFFMQLLLACLSAGLASFTTEKYSYRSEGFGRHPDVCFNENETSSVGLLPGLAFKTDHTTFEALLASEVESFFRLTQGH